MLAETTATASRSAAVIDLVSAKSEIWPAVSGWKSRPIGTCPTSS
jgi:hypothetical protein